MGPRLRDGRAQALLAGDRREGLLLRSPTPLAAWIERKHQRTTAAVLPERNGSVGHQSKQAQRGRTTAERATQRNAQLRNAGRTLWPMCCVDRLNPQSIALIPSSAKAAPRPVSSVPGSSVYDRGVPAWRRGVTTRRSRYASRPRSSKELLMITNP